MTSSTPGGADELSRTLRTLRRAAGGGRAMTLVEAAEQTGFSTAKISRMERGKNAPTEQDIEVFTRVYGADLSTKRRLAQMARDLQESTRRIVLSTRPNRAAFQDLLRRLDEQSARVVEFGAIFVPGLVQTPEFVRSVFATTGEGPEATNAAVAARLTRASILDNPRKEVLILLTEGALGWSLGPPSLMISQLAYLDDISRKTANTRLGIVPFGTPSPVMPVSGWTLWDERTVVPSILATQAVFAPPHVAPYVSQLQQLEDLAVFGDEARAVLRRAAEHYRSLA